MGAHVDAAAPIGVFDSGLGGLTVAHAIRLRWPGERLVYLGDTARVPYGTRSPKTVLAYARSCAKKLREHDIQGVGTPDDTDPTFVADPDLVRRRGQR